MVYYVAFLFDSLLYIEGIDTSFSAMAVTPQTPKWWHFGVCGAMTENEVSMSIQSWYHNLINIVKLNCVPAFQVKE